MTTVARAGRRRTEGLAVGSARGERDGGLERVAVVVAFVVVAAGVVLRFWTRSHLWLDEALTVDIARLPLRQIPRWLRHDGAPPLYYVLLHAWTDVFGTSALGVRSLGGAFSVLTIPVVWRCGRRLGGPEGGRRTAFVTVLLLASSPFAVRYATETRMYSLVVLLSALGVLALARVVESDSPSAIDLAGLTVVTAALLYTHYWAMYLLAVVGLCVVARAALDHDRRRWVLAAGALAAGGALFLPWMPTVLYQGRHTGTPWAVPASFSAMVNAISEFAGGPSSSGRALGLIFFALAGLGLFGAAAGPRAVDVDLRTRPRGRPLAITVVGSLVVAIGMGFLTHGAFAARYAAIVFAPFLLLVALGTTVFLDRRVLAGVVGAAVVFGLLSSASNVTTERTQAGHVAAAIRASAAPGDVVAYCPDQLGPAVSRLLPHSLDQVTFPRTTAPSLVDWVDYAQHNAASDPAAFARILDQRAGPAHAVWLVWAAGYRTLGTRCEEVVQQLAGLRPGSAEIVQAEPTKYFEHASLEHYPAR